MPVNPESTSLSVLDMARHPRGVRRPGTRRSAARVGPRGVGREPMICHRKTAGLGDAAMTHDHAR